MHAFLLGAGTLSAKDHSYTAFNKHKRLTFSNLVAFNTSKAKLDFPS